MPWGRDEGPPSAALTLAAGLAAALPVIVSCVHALQAGWLPVGDDAIIAVRSIDVLSSHPPLVGQFSIASGGGPTTHGLGPLLYWLLAVPARVGPDALVLTMGVVNAACVMGTVALARRRGGLPLMFVVAAAMAVMCASLVPDTLHSVWNPSAAQLPMTLLMFVGWSVACGERQLLPLGVLVGSFVVQCHLTYVLPTLAVAAVALWGLRRWSRGPGAGVDWRRTRRVALAVAVVCWIAPLADQVVERPGNLAAVGRAATVNQPKLGPEVGWNTVARSVGVPPWWLRRPQDPFTRLAEVVSSPAVLTSLSAAALLAALVGALLLARRRERDDVVALAAIALGLVVALGLVATSTPKLGGLDSTVSYTLRWSSPAGMFAWIAVGWSWAVLVAPRVTLASGLARAAPAAGLAVAVVAGVVVAAGLGPDLIEGRYRPTEAVIRAVRGAAEPAPELAVRGTDPTFDVAGALAYDARRRRGQVLAPSLSDQLGDSYDGSLAGSQLVSVADGSRAGPGRVVIRRPFPVVALGRVRQGPVTVTIGRGR